MTNFEYLGKTFEPYSTMDASIFLRGERLISMSFHGYSHDDFYKEAKKINAEDFNVFKYGDSFVVPCEGNFIVTCPIKAN